MIAGRRFLQLSAHCSLDTPAIVALLVRRLSSEGWRLQRRSPALIQAERYGTPVGQALRVMARENRDMRMAEAEKKAAALPPKLTVPMIQCL